MIVRRQTIRTELVSRREELGCAVRECPHAVATIKADIEFGWQAVIQAPKLEPRIKRYELTDPE
jgi:hypothetical protein